MLSVLHLSDVHFSRDRTKHAFQTDEGGGNLAPRRLIEAIQTALKGDKWKIDAIALTGDVSCKCDDDEFSTAVGQLLELAESLQVPRENVLLIPGNHDVNWEAPAPDKRFDRFRTAFQLFFGKRPPGNLAQVIDLTSEKGTRVRLIGVNSALLESKEDAGIGMVHEDILRKVFSEAGSAPGALTVLCLHHHLLPVAHVERDYQRTKRTSVTLDAKAILGVCAENKVQLVLHGHQHQPALACYSAVDPLRENSSSPFIWISGAGSAGLDRRLLGDVGKRHFQILEFEAASGGKCTIHSYTSTNGDEFSFERVARKPIPLDMELGHLTNEKELCQIGRRTALAFQSKKKEGKVDNSDLYILLMKAKRCQKTVEWLVKFAENAKKNEDSCNVEEIFDLYGHYDLLVKVRSKAGDLPIRDLIINPLHTNNLIDSHDDFNIQAEHYPHGRLFLNQDCDQGIRAFVYCSQVSNVQALMDISEEAAKKLSESSATTRHSLVLVRGVYTLGKQLFIEYYLTCGGFDRLNEIMHHIENYTERGGNGEKTTYVVQKYHSLR